MMNKKKITEKELEELVDLEGGMISGDRNVTNNSEIETGPVQKPWNDDSDYEKGMSTTTDRATRYRQNIPWFAVYSYRSASGRGLPINEKKIGPIQNVKSKKQLEEEIMEDLVKKSKKDGDVWDKNYNGKFEKVIDIINDTELNDEQLKKIKKAVLDKINSKNA
jgi:hypothetical protein